MPQLPPAHHAASVGPRAGRRWCLALLSIALLSATLLLAPAVQAGDEFSERENLTRIANEIEHLQVMVAQAAKDAPAGQRVNFRYDWLQGDLELLREGIAQHLDAPRQPRPVPPLRGNYRQ